MIVIYLLWCALSGYIIGTIAGEMDNHVLGLMLVLLIVISNILLGYTISMYALRF